MPVQSSIDYKLYKYNNERVSGLFDPVKYPGGLAWLGMAEFTALGQTLKDPDKTGTTKLQTGLAGDVNVRVMLDRLRLRFDASYRDLAFILHSVSPACRPTRTSRASTRPRRTSSPPPASTRTGTTS